MTRVCLFFLINKKWGKIFYQVDVIKDESGFVHLAQDEEHLIVNELFVLHQVTVHVLFQLCADLPKKKSSSFVSPMVNFMSLPVKG